MAECEAMDRSTAENNLKYVRCTNDAARECDGMYGPHLEICLNASCSQGAVITKCNSAIQSVVDDRKAGGKGPGIVETCTNTCSISESNATSLAGCQFGTLKKLTAQLEGLAEKCAKGGEEKPPNEPELADEAPLMPLNPPPAKDEVAGGANGGGTPPAVGDSAKISVPNIATGSGYTGSEASGEATSSGGVNFTPTASINSNISPSTYTGSDKPAVKAEVSPVDGGAGLGSGASGSRFPYAGSYNGSKKRALTGSSQFPITTTAQYVKPGGRGRVTNRGVTRVAAVAPKLSKKIVPACKGDDMDCLFKRFGGLKNRGVASEKWPKDVGRGNHDIFMQAVRFHDNNIKLDHQGLLYKINY